MLSQNIGMDGLGSNTEVFSEKSTETSCVEYGPGTIDMDLTADKVDLLKTEPKEAR